MNYSMKNKETLALEEAYNLILEKESCKCNCKECKGKNCGKCSCKSCSCKGCKGHKKSKEA